MCIKKYIKSLLLVKSLFSSISIVFIIAKSVFKTVLGLYKLIGRKVFASMVTLRREARQGDSICAYIFILVMEVLFTLIKRTEQIQVLDTLNDCFLYSPYADDSTFFL